MKCFVYGVYILDVIQSTVITEIEFRIFVTYFGDVQVFNRIETAWLIPILTAIGEPSRTEHERVTSNIPPSHILRSGILCASDQIFGTIEEICRSHYCCKFSKEVYFISELIGVKNVARYTALFHSTWRWDNRWGSCEAEKILHRALAHQADGLPID